MKRFIMIMLVAVMALTMVACGKKAPVASESSIPDKHLSPPDSSSVPKDVPLPEKRLLANGVTTLTIDVNAIIPGRRLREFFPYNDSYYAMILQEGDYDNLDPTIELYFIDPENGKILDKYYTFEHDSPTGEFYSVVVYEALDGYHVCCDEIAYVISGSPETSIDIKKIDYNRADTKKIDVISSKDGKWYAYVEDDAVLVNTETGERITPYVGRREGDDEVTYTASRPAGFSEDYFFFRTVGYEWFNGYGAYNLKTGEVSLYDDLVDLYISPTNANSNRFPYTVLWEEFGYIDTSDLSKRVTLFNPKETTEGEIFDALQGCRRFTSVNIGNGQYLGTFAENADNACKFAAIDSESLKVVYTSDFGELSSYPYTLGKYVAFFKTTVDTKELTIISFP